MPSTFPTHPVAVLPLKLWRPRWFDGVALALGSMAPDAAYVLDGSGLPVWPFSHEPLGLIGWCLPLTVLGTWMLRRATPTIAVHLPNGGSFALRDYGAIGAARHRWWITAISALIGAAKGHAAVSFLDGRRRGRPTRNGPDAVPARGFPPSHHGCPPARGDRGGVGHRGGGNLGTRAAAQRVPLICCDGSAPMQR